MIYPWKMMDLCIFEWGIVGKVGNHQTAQVHWTSREGTVKNDYVDIYTFYREQAHCIAGGYSTGWSKNLKF